MHGRRTVPHLAALLLAALWLTTIAGCRGGADGLLLNERFGNPESGWGADSREEFDRGYQDGKYVIEVYAPDWLAWAHPGRQFRDVDVTVEDRQASGGSDGHYGLLCRYNRGDFYYFAITPDGYYAILLIRGGEQTVLSGDGFLPTSAVRPVGEVNIIRAVCDGVNLSMYVNGQHLATVRDDVLRRGDVGVAVGSGPSGGIRVLFDNLQVAPPQPGGGEGQ